MGTVGKGRLERRGHRSLPWRSSWCSRDEERGLITTSFPRLPFGGRRTGLHRGGDVWGVSKVRTGRGGSQACGPTWSCANQEEIRTAGAQGLQRWEAGRQSGDQWGSAQQAMWGAGFHFAVDGENRVLKAGSDGQIFVLVRTFCQQSEDWVGRVRLEAPSQKINLRLPLWPVIISTAYIFVPDHVSKDGNHSIRHSLLFCSPRKNVIYCPPPELSMFWQQNMIEVLLCDSLV